jgi:hypothetical protein
MVSASCCVFSLYNSNERAIDQAGCPLDRLDAHYLRNLLLEHALDTVRESQLRHRASAACSLKRYLDHAIVANLNQLDVTAVRLEGRTDLVEDCLNLFPVQNDPPHA